MSEKTESSCGVTALQIVLPSVSAGVKSEESWEWPDFGGDRLNSGNGKTKRATMHNPRDSCLQR